MIINFVLAVLLIWSAAVSAGGDEKSSASVAPITACAAFAQGDVAVVILAGEPLVGDDGDGEWYADWSDAVNEFTGGLPKTTGIAVMSPPTNFESVYSVYLYRKGTKGVVVQQATERMEYQAAFLQITGQPPAPDQPRFDFAEATPSLLTELCTDQSLTEPK